MLCGVITVVAVPLLLKKHIGIHAANLTGLLIAVSPFLIVQSRFARPYTVSFLLSIAAVLFFYRWWLEGGKKYWLSYVLCATVSSYFLLLNLPFLLSPFLFFLFFPHKTEGGAGLLFEARFRKLFGLGLATLVALCIVLGPPIINDFAALSGKASSASGNLQAYADALLLLGGETSALLALGFFSVAGVGLFIAARSRNLLVLYLSFLGLMQLLTIVVVSPVGIDYFIILARYLLLLSVVFFVLFAIGFVKLVEQIKNRLALNGNFSAIPTPLIALLAVAAFVCSGPLTKAYYSPNNNLGLMLISEIVLGDSVADVTLNYIPEFYLRLADQQAESVELIEAPFHYNFDYFPVYQKLNKQNISLGFINGLCSPARSGEIPVAYRQDIELNSTYYLADGLDLRNSTADFVVFHTNIEEEVAVPFVGDAIDITECVSRFRLWFGEPVFLDKSITVFKLR